jgi:5-methylcytosine-specific restriction endonuclease McrA
VYAKYGGHCAYCGREIAYKDMQVDHFIPKDMEFVFISGNVPGMDSVDDIGNLMPSCRSCNHYKRANSLEMFRRWIAEIPRKLRNDYIYKIGVIYGNIIENEKPIRFYFEMEAERKAREEDSNEQANDL